MNFRDMLEEYLFGGYISSGYWRRYKDRWWLHRGDYGYKGLRKQVLAKQKKRTAFRAKKDFKEMLAGPSLFDKLGMKKDSGLWGSTLIVPFKFNE